MSSLKVLQYDIENLPVPPFTVYFLDKNQQVHPKRMFTVIKKEINEEKAIVELHIMGLPVPVAFTADTVDVCQLRFPN